MACVWCSREIWPGQESVEHVIPRSKGGPTWPENLVDACRPCNTRRGTAPPAAWLDRCEAEGLRPDRAAVERSLLATRAAIARRGGMRRARPYLDGQLRRLRLA